MDPRISWHPSELNSQAFSTWANIWMIAQMNCTSTAQSNVNNANTSTKTAAAAAAIVGKSKQPSSNPIDIDELIANLTNNVHTSETTPISANANSQSTSNMNNLNSAVTSQSIINGLKSSRKVNKASTFGYNFPIFQQVLDDPMSTPWNFLSPIDETSEKDEEIRDDEDSVSSISSCSTSSSNSIESSIQTLSQNQKECDLTTYAPEYSEGLMTLHKEILLFTSYIQPSFEELYMRNEMVWRISKVIKEQLPHVQVDVFGSYKTGLFLPTSDIDLIVFGEWKHHNQLPLNFLKDALVREKITDAENIRVLDRATVPIIKIVEQKTELKIDISFNTLNGIKSAELIKNYMAEFPCLKPLVMVLKQFLIQRDFNEVWTGGIGSYSLILMIVSYLQLHSRFDPRSHNYNLGVMLIEFFELYGRSFNYMKTGIRILNGGCYLPKEELLKQFNNSNTPNNNTNTNGTNNCNGNNTNGVINNHRSSILCIEDPLNPSNDIGKGSYGALKVKQAFEYAYFTLSHAVMPQNEFLLKNLSNKKCSNGQPANLLNKSILGRIIRITKEVRDYRAYVKAAFSDRLKYVYEITGGLMFYHPQFHQLISQENQIQHQQHQQQQHQHQHPQQQFHQQHRRHYHHQNVAHHHNTHNQFNHVNNSHHHQHQNHNSFNHSNAYNRHHNFNNHNHHHHHHHGSNHHHNHNQNGHNNYQHRPFVNFHQATSNTMPSSTTTRATPPQITITNTNIDSYKAGLNGFDSNCSNDNKIKTTTSTTVTSNSDIDDTIPTIKLDLFDVITNGSNSSSRNSSTSGNSNSSESSDCGNSSNSSIHSGDEMSTTSSDVFSKNTSSSYSKNEDEFSMWLKKNFIQSTKNNEHNRKPRQYSQQQMYSNHHHSLANFRSVTTNLHQRNNSYNKGSNNQKYGSKNYQQNNRNKYNNYHHQQQHKSNPIIFYLEQQDEPQTQQEKSNTQYGQEPSISQQTLSSVDNNQAITESSKDENKSNKMADASTDALMMIMKSINQLNENFKTCNKCKFEKSKNGCRCRDFERDENENNKKFVDQNYLVENNQMNAYDAKDLNKNAFNKNQQKLNSSSQQAVNIKNSTTTTTTNTKEQITRHLLSVISINTSSSTPSLMFKNNQQNQKEQTLYGNLHNSYVNNNSAPLAGSIINSTNNAAISSLAS